MFWGGLTYNSHALCLGTAIACIEVLVEEDMVGNAARMEKVVRREMERMQAKHESVKSFRCIGLFGMMDLQRDTKGTPLAPYNGGHPAMNELAKFFKDNGLFTFTRWGSFMVNPPLCITEAQLMEGFEIIDRGLDRVDRHVEG